MTTYNHQHDNSNHGEVSSQSSDLYQVLPEEELNIGSPPSPSQILKLQRTIGNQATLQLMGKPSNPSLNLGNLKMKSGRMIQRFATQSAIRKSKFVATATSAPNSLAPNDAEKLWSISGGAGGDPIVAGFEDKKDFNLTMARAKQHVQAGGKAFNAHASIKNLGGLNSKFGHNKADEYLAILAGMVRDEVDKAGGDIAKFRRNGTELELIVVSEEDKPVTQGNVEAQLMHAEAEIRKYVVQEGLDSFLHPKHPLDWTQNGTGMEYNVNAIESSESNDENADQSDNEDASEKSHGRGVSFKSTAQDRKDKFIETAQQDYNLSENNAAELYNLSGSDEVDTLTGFDKAGERKPTLDKAIGYIRDNQGVSGVYVEVDIRNLGGLSNAKGYTEASKYLAEMATIAEKTLMQQVKADVSRFRHGGDEFSFIVVGEDATLDMVGKAMTAAQAAVAQWVEDNNLGDIEHPKHPNEANKRGTGIIFGLGAITGQQDEDKDAIISTADQQVEAKKKS